MSSELKFIWIDCELCGPTVLCPRCGNNCCNGGYGPLDLSVDHWTPEQCPVCPLAYQYASACYHLDDDKLRERCVETNRETRWEIRKAWKEKFGSVVERNTQET